MNTNMSQMHEQKSIPNGPWDTLKSKVDFDAPARATSSSYGEYMDLLNHYLSFLVDRSRIRGFHSNQVRGYGTNEMVLTEDGEYNSFNHSSKNNNNNFSKHLKECLIPLLLVGHYNNIDLADLLIEQYQISNLSSIKEYISRSSLFDELESNRNIDPAEKNKVESMLKNYLNCYTKYIEQPVPGDINDIPSTFKPFNDKMDNVLLYFSKLNFCINQQNMIKTRPTQFDVYFVPPNAPNDLDDLKISGMVKSCPNNRFGANQGTQDIYHLLSSQQAQKLLNPVDDNGKQRNKRVILLIVRKNINNTNSDILYLFVDTLPYDLKQKSCFKYNELLWKLNTKRDIINKKLNVDDCKYSTNYNLFSISYHLKPNSKNTYFYFNGFGSKITKKNISSKWSFMFGSKHGNNGISCISMNNLFETKYNETYQEIKNYDDEFGQYLFGLKYSFCPYQKTSRQTLTFPKDVLQHALKQIAEFDEQQQLYYYLTWSCKMQLIHKQYLHFTLKHRQPKEIAIFNTELTDSNSKDELYIVAILNDKNNSNNNNKYYRNYNNNNNYNNYNNKPKWRMNQFMTAKQIYNIYGINNNDLPKGSRFLSNYFQDEIKYHREQICNNNIEKVRNWNHIEKICSQQFRHNTPRFSDYDLNKAIKESIEDIRKNYGDLELIPILNIDTKNDSIRVEALIPIKVRNRWIAISYKKSQRSYKAMVHQLFIDQDDIINKASLVDPAQFHGLQWLKGNNNNNNNNNYASKYNKQSFMRYKPKSKNNNNNNFAMRPKLTNDKSGDSAASAASTQSVQSAQSIGSLGSLKSFDTDNTFPSLQLNHSISSQTMISATPIAFTNNDSNNSNNNNNNSNNNNGNPTETIMVGQLRQQLNDALTMANSVMRDSQYKDRLIAQQEQQIKQLQQQIEQQKLLLRINPSLPPYVPLNHTNTIPPFPTLNHNNSNASNTSKNDTSNTPSPIGTNTNNNNNNNNNNMVSNGNNMAFPTTLFPNNFNVLSVANQYVPTASIPAFVPTNSFSLINNTPPASICNNAALTVPNYSILPKSNSNSPQMPFPNNTQF